MENNNKYKIRDFMGNELTVQAQLELYSVQDFTGKEMPGLAILLMDVTNEDEPEFFCDLTVSFGEFIGMKNCAYIDTNNCDFADQLLAQGIAKTTGFTKHSGFCVYPLWVFDEQTLKAMGAENYEKYSTEYDQYMSAAYAEIESIDEEGETE